MKKSIVIFCIILFAAFVFIGCSPKVEEPAIVKYLPQETNFTDMANQQFSWTTNNNNGQINHYEYSMDKRGWQITNDSSILWETISDGTHTLDVRGVLNDDKYTNTINWTFSNNIEYLVEYSNVDGDKLQILSVSPAASTTVNYEEKIHILVDYEVNSIDEFYIWVKPIYKNGVNPVGNSGSYVYEKGSGVISKFLVCLNTNEATQSTTADVLYIHCVEQVTEEDIIEGYYEDLHIIWK